MSASPSAAPTPAASSSPVAAALAVVARRIGAASAVSGRSNEPRLVAVSKTKPAAAVREAYAAGQRHFGENYVQEVVSKAGELSDLAGIKWHYIGALQSNKAKALVSVKGLWCVESVDRVKTAAALQKAVEGAGGAATDGGRLRVLVQVNTSGEESKSGCAIEEAGDLAEYVMRECRLLELGGLMTIGAPGDSGAFAVLSNTRVEVAQRLGVAKDSLELSMGMSGDFEEAILAGSDSVRIGSTIFGAREYPAAAGSK
jgi:PLP dependent protein